MTPEQHQLQYQVANGPVIVANPKGKQVESWD